MAYKRIKKYYILILAIGIVLYAFRNWFFSPVVLGNDFNQVNYDIFRIHSVRPYLWDSSLSNSFGQYTLFTLPFFNYAFILNLLTSPIQNPFLLHKIIFLTPLLAISILSTYYLAITFLKNKLAQAIVIILYLTNPYFLMLTSGGQLGVAFAYGFAPLVFAFAYKILKTLREHHQIPAWYYPTGGLLISLHITFDSRLALLTLAIIGILLFIFTFIYKDKIQLIKMYLIFVISLSIIVPFTHAHWLLPSLLIKQVSLPTGYTNASSVDFFSFARFAHALTWTHPNYPENIFGQVKEVHGLAFLLPLFAFFLISHKRKLVLFLSSVALVSAFLIKGTNPPFSETYIWLFQNIPLFSWYRDSTKFFLPLSLSFSILIGLTIQYLYNKNKVKGLVGTTTLLVAVLIIWWPTFSNQIGGTLQYRTYPAEFQQLQNILQSDQSFGRVLWIPYREIYGYADLNHPAVSLQELRRLPSCIPELCVVLYQGSDTELFTKNDLLREIDQLLAFLNSPPAAQTLQKMGINYIAISPDVDKKMYWFDRKYDDQVNQYYQNKISQMAWLQKVGTKDSILYKTNQTGGFITDHKNESVEYQMISPVEYRLTISEGTDRVYVSQSYDPSWRLYLNNREIEPTKEAFNLTSYNSLPSGEATLRYQGQQIANIGQYLSQISLLIVVGAIIMLRRKVAKAL